MPAWFLFLHFLILFSACRGLWLNVTRGTQNTGGQDLFTNMHPSARCPNRQPFPDAGRTWCLARKGECSNKGCCICKCSYSFATFRMNVNPYLAKCASNTDIRAFSGCTKRFASEAESNPLVTLDLSQSGSKGIPYFPNGYTCVVKSAEYLNITWRQLPQKQKDFSIRGIRGWVKNELRWNGNMPHLYFGYIMRAKWECRKGPHKSENGCVVFKAKGALSLNLANPTTQTPLVTTALSTTTKSPTTASTRRVSTPSPSTSTMQVKSTTPVRVTRGKTTLSPTTFRRKAPSTKTKTAKASSSPSPTRRLQTTSHSTSQGVTGNSTEPAAVTTETLPTESTTLGDVITTIEPTYRSVASKEPNKGRNKLSGKKDEDDNMMVIIVAGVAAVICVAIVLLCIWLIITQRRKHRHGASFGTGTTVIANPTTSSQNHFPMPGLLKNPVCEDAVYADPEEKVRKSAVGLLGNPSYETCHDLLLKNPGATESKTIPLNNIQKKPLNTAKRIPAANEITYDCADVRSNNGGKPDGEKNIYQSLVKEEARPRYKPEVNVATYQSLNPDSLMYQPLVKGMAHKRQEEIPEYLVLLNPNESTEKISPSPPEYQPPYSTGPPPADVEESPEYADYADLDELEEIEASHRTSDQGPSYSAPLYNVLEGPGCEYASAPMYAVLEGLDPYSVGNTNSGFEPPFYAVLEGPESN